jgi:hypothetical protein
MNLFVRYGAVLIGEAQWVLEWFLCILMLAHNAEQLVVMPDA